MHKTDYDFIKRVVEDDGFPSSFNDIHYLNYHNLELPVQAAKLIILKINVIKEWFNEQIKDNDKL